MSTAPSSALVKHREAARQLLEAAGDLRPSLFREAVEGAAQLMVDAAQELERRADAAAQTVTLAGELADVLEELTEALREAIGRDQEAHDSGHLEVLTRGREVAEQLRALTVNIEARR